MKTIGILGGMSYQSTITYYQGINDEVNRFLGGLHCAKMLLANVDFGEVEALLAKQEWDRIADVLSDWANKLQAGGANGLIIATNTMHQVYEAIRNKTGMEILHIGDAVYRQCEKRNLNKVLLLGTYPTMTLPFMKDRLSQQGLAVVTPNMESDLRAIDDIIFEELCKGVIKPESKQVYLKIIERCAKQENIEAVILGCTEIGLLIGDTDTDLPLIDSTIAHIEMAVEWMLEEK
jgi:aspartate racemase